MTATSLRPPRGQHSVLARRARARRVHRDPAVDPGSGGGHRRARNRRPRRARGRAAPARGRAGRAAQLGAAGRARQGAGRAVGRARDRDRLRRGAGRAGAAVPGDHRARLLAGGAAGRARRRVRAAVARGLPGRGSRSRAGPDRAAVRDRARPRRGPGDDRDGLADGVVLRGLAAANGGIWRGRPAEAGAAAAAAAAVPDRRDRRGLRRADRRLPPDRARADRHRPGCRSPAAGPAVR